MASGEYFMRQLDGSGRPGGGEGRGLKSHNKLFPLTKGFRPQERNLLWTFRITIQRVHLVMRLLGTLNAGHMKDLWAGTKTSLCYS